MMESIRIIVKTGKAGLMYPSDYVYTFVKGVEHNCYANIYKCTTSNSETPSSSWLYNGSIKQWTISPNAGNSADSFLVNSHGNVEGHWCSNNVLGVRPTVYLRSDVLLTGTGTEAAPDEIIS